MPPDSKVSDQLEQWLRGDQPKTLGSLIDTFGKGSFAIAFVLLMALPALPLPTGGATHVLEIVTMLLALELIVGRNCVWLPRRWQGVQLGGGSREKFITVLLKRIRWLERFSRPRAPWLFGHRLTGLLFGLAVFGLALTAFLAPPFSGLDTLPSIGVVVVALGVLMTDIAVAVAGLVIGAAGIVTVITLSRLAINGVGGLF
jgi:hypothetical protein